MSSNSKFFGQPNGTKAPAKQSKLAFSSKSSPKAEIPSSGSAKENEDVDMEEDGSDVEVNPKVENGNAEKIKPKVEETEESGKEKVKNGEGLQDFG
jgi:DNA ligase-1